MISVSFIIPCREINPMVVHLVQSLSVLLPRDHEVVVSLDRNWLQASEKEILAGFPAATRLWLSDSDQAQGPAKARNHGATKSSADWLVFIDSDMVLPFSFAPELVARLQKAKVPDVATTRIGGLNRNIFSDYFSDHTFRVREIEGRLLFPSAILLIRRSLYERVGGFDEGFPDAAGEDWDFLIRANDVKPGLSVGYHADLLAFHSNPQTLAELLGRAFRYGLHAHRYLRKSEFRSGPILRLAQIALRETIAPANRAAVRLENMVRGKLWPQKFRPLSSLKFGVFQVIRTFQATDAPINRSPQKFILADRVSFRLMAMSRLPRRVRPVPEIWKITNAGVEIVPEILDGYPHIPNPSNRKLTRLLLTKLWGLAHRGGVILGYAREKLSLSAEKDSSITGFEEPRGDKRAPLD